MATMTESHDRRDSGKTTSCPDSCLGYRGKMYKGRDVNSRDDGQQQQQDLQVVRVSCLLKAPSNM